MNPSHSKQDKNPYNFSRSQELFDNQNPSSVFEVSSCSFSRSQELSNLDSNFREKFKEIFQQLKELRNDQTQDLFLVNLMKQTTIFGTKSKFSTECSLYFY